MNCDYTSLAFNKLRHTVSLLGIVLCSMGLLRAEMNVFPTGARSAALGNASVTAANVYAVYNNQAALGFVDNTYTSVDYLNRFLMPELHTAAASFATPVPYAGTVGASVCSFGTSPYNELRASLALGKRLSQYIAIGAAVDYHQISIAHYGSTGAITAEVGVLANPLQQLWVGAHVYNFTYSRFLSNIYSEQLPVIFNVGAGYQIISTTALFLQGEFSSNQKGRFKAGVEHFLLPAFAIRVGTTLQPVELFAGVGYTLRSWTIDVAVAHHQTLGYSPHLSLSYIFGKGKM